jgi:penicillin-binding protein 2
MSNLFEPYRDAKARRKQYVEDALPSVGIEEALPDSEDSESLLKKRETSALRWFLVFSLIAVGLLVGKSAHLQIVQNNVYESLAQGNRNRLIPLLAPRGIIYDRFGVPLVKNIPSFDAVLIPVDLPKEKNEQTEVLKKVSATLSLKGGDLEEIANKADKTSFQPILVKGNISRDEALIMESQTEKTSGIRVNETSIRNYPQNDLLSHTLGYVGKITREELDKKTADAKDYLLNDSIGKSGIESSYEDILRGELGQEEVEVDAKGNIQKTLATKTPTPGTNLVLTIDEGLQEKLRDLLVDQVEKAGVSKAAAVAMDPRDGSVLALVSVPSYDNNLFSNGISQKDYDDLTNNSNKPLFNNAVTGAFPPGSTFKPFLAAAGLQEGMITPDTTVNSTGGVTVGGRTFHDHKPGGHGITNLNKAIALSVNTYFYCLGGGCQGISGLGIDRIDKYAKLFGFGDYVGVDINSESKGLLPSPDWKEQSLGESWFIGDTFNTSIGQGYVAVTPLQLAAGYSVLANGGTYFKPHLLYQTFTSDPKTRVTKSPEIVRKDFISKDHLAEVKRALQETVLTGSGRSLLPLNIDAAGKTGTAQFVINNKTGEIGEHAWFATFAPASDPKIVLVVLVEGAGEGHANSVPVAKDALQWYFSRGDVQDKLGK